MQYSVRHVSKTVQGPHEAVHILTNVNLDVASGEGIAILGASGCGKSTLLHILGALDTPTEGEILYEGKNLSSLDNEKKAQFRNKELGFVFQFHHLLPEFTTLENVAMQALIGGTPRNNALAMAEEALLAVGLKERLAHNVTTLSGGERQRAAIARAILQKPRVLLADEPTGNLDEKTGEKVIDLLLTLGQNQNMTLLVVTHNQQIAARMGRSFELKSGELYEQ